MSDTPTSDQLSDLRIDIGDTGTPPGLTDAEVQRFWYRVRGADDEVTQHEATLALMARALMSKGAKLRDHSTGNTSERMSQVYDHLKDIYTMYKPALNRALGANADIAIGVVGGVEDGEVPFDEGGGSQLGYWAGSPQYPEGTEFA
ncbi:MAG: hypothetical protein KF716_08770 [Anaerolineae bacterium]|nr:hypothetical protein [Anaerolineae bacterium]